jgi:hypothetical protein
MRKTIPAKDVDFNEKQIMISSKTEKMLVEWNINADWFNKQLMPAKVAWIYAWDAYQNPNLRTRMITFSKNATRKTYQALLSMLVDMLKSNPLVTPGNLEEMGIDANRGGGNVRNLAPKTYPDFSIDSSVLRLLSIIFRDHGSTSRAKPHGVHGAEIRWDILDARPTDISDLSHSAFDTHSPFTLEFGDRERGKTVWLCLRWESTTGKKGPWSEIQSAIVP